jgi:5S rRNA maturation endonuclease (ribonuclease M5)
MNFKDTKKPILNIPPSFVKTALYGNVFPIKKQTKHWFISCPFHKDSSPSLSVVVASGHRAPVGTWNCFGCSKSGRWNSLAEKLNLPTVDKDNPEISLESNYISFNELEDNPSDYSPPLNSSPWPTDKYWRNFPGTILNKHNGLYVPLDINYNLWLPCISHANKKVTGIIKCTEKKKSISYLFTEGAWLSEYLWPEATLKFPIKTVVLVEGVRDALAFLINKIPALAVLGTQSGFTDNRIYTLYSLGVNRVILFMDGDSPGKKASYALRKLLAKDFDVDIFKTWKHFPDKDPFNILKDKIFVKAFKQKGDF